MLNHSILKVASEMSSERIFKKYVDLTYIDEMLSEVRIIRQLTGMGLVLYLMGPNRSVCHPHRPASCQTES